MQGTPAVCEMGPDDIPLVRSTGLCGENGPHSLVYIWGTILFY